MGCLLDPQNSNGKRRIVTCLWLLSGLYCIIRLFETSRQQQGAYSEVRLLALLWDRLIPVPSCRRQRYTRIYPVCDCTVVNS